MSQGMLMEYVLFPKQDNTKIKISNRILIVNKNHAVYFLTHKSRKDNTVTILDKKNGRELDFSFKDPLKPKSDVSIKMSNKSAKSLEMAFTHRGVFEGFTHEKAKNFLENLTHIRDSQGPYF